MIATGLLLALAGGAGTPPALLFQLNYNPETAPGQPDYEDTLANLIYPLAKGPASMGYPTEPLPVMLSIRGGNMNTIEVGELTTDEMTLSAKDVGFIGITFNYPEVEPTEDYRVSSRGVGLLVQHLRANHADLNVDPDRIFAMGRSYGTIVGHATCLQEDFADPQATEPQLQESSRPDYWIPRFGPSDLTCFSDDVGAWSSILSTFFFTDTNFSGASQEMKLAESPFWWLQNPQLFGRTETPPMCVVHKAVHSDKCGGVVDVHSGLFGDIMLEAAREYADQVGDRSYLDKLGTVDTGQFPNPVPAILAWSMQRLADDFDGLFLVPPTGTVGATGGDLELAVFGATPGGFVSFFTGTQVSSFPLVGCPGVEGKIVDFVPVGTSQVDSKGSASVSFSVAPSMVGTQAVFHAADFDSCETSNVSVHVYY